MPASVTLVLARGKMTRAEVAEKVGVSVPVIQIINCGFALCEILSKSNSRIFTEYPQSTYFLPKNATQCSIVELC